MFQMTLLDHIRLTFGQVVHRYKAHVRSAERLSRWIWQVRAIVLVLTGGTLAAAVTAVETAGGPYDRVTAVLAALALVAYAVSVSLQLEARLYAHRWCASRLWLIREQYYALIAEITDGVVDLDQARARRDALMKELHAVYKHAPLADRVVYQSARDSLRMADDAALADEEIDRFLPVSLRKAAAAAAGIGGETAEPAGTPGAEAGYSGA